MPNATTPMDGDFGGCTLDSYDIVADVLVDVSAVVDGTGGYTNLVYYFATGGRSGLQVNGSPALLSDIRTVCSRALSGVPRTVGDARGHARVGGLTSDTNMCTVDPHVSGRPG